MAKKVVIKIISNMVKIVLFILIVINFYILFEIKSDVSNISLYDIESNLDDVYSTIQNIESDINSIKDNIGDEYDYGTILYKLRIIEYK